jgi:hypothetical protein
MATAARASFRMLFSQFDAESQFGIVLPVPRRASIELRLQETAGHCARSRPHPYWGDRPQALHVSIETKRQDMFELLIAAGADINGTNGEYEHWSPLMLTFHWDQPAMWPRRRTLRVSREWRRHGTRCEELVRRGVPSL